ncbi:peptidase inhibitor family I36 protein [Streptomyces sp. NPDC005989]|uniref:peptidase inhibitor family I36 protein n=1 Tax=Streptomyces sp. NPDC005989 TaxID=3156727 RepID=UPI0033C4791E
MIKKIALALTMTLAAAVPVAGSASAADSPVREIRGQGLEACPEQSLCLYQDTNFNAGGDARIWIITDDVPQLSKYDANDRASSAYVHYRNHHTVVLWTDSWYTGDRSWHMSSDGDKHGKYSTLDEYNDDVSSVLV